MDPVSIVIIQYLCLNVLHYTFFHLFRSKDSTARIWTILDGPCGSKMQNGRQNEIMLEHCKGDMNQTTQDVTALDWNVSVIILVVAELSQLDVKYCSTSAYVCYC